PSLDGLSDLLLPLGILGGKPAAESIAAAEQALAEEVALIVFPAGAVSRLGWRGVRDARWRRGFLRFAENANAPIVPVHVSGRNSAWFYGLSRLRRRSVRRCCRARCSRAPRSTHRTARRQAGDAAAVAGMCRRQRRF
ncbi:MAG: hypothetical protein IPG63_17530, partial [Xanthomonadales bacterium]|nr:hypothetical protein [Xanthomonadales bacterium]